MNTKTDDPRLQHSENDPLNTEDEQYKHHLQQAIDSAEIEATAADMLLDDPMVSAFFENIMKKAYSDFLELPEGANEDDFRKVHMPAKAIMRLRDMLRSKKDRLNTLYLQRETFNAQLGKEF